MSLTLYWRPRKGKRHRVGKAQLLEIFRPLAGYDGHGLLNHTHVQYVQCLVSAGVVGAQNLLAAIDKYGEIQIIVE